MGTLIRWLRRWWCAWRAQPAAEATAPPPELFSPMFSVEAMRAEAAIHNDLTEAVAAAIAAMFPPEPSPRTLTARDIEQAYVRALFAVLHAVHVRAYGS